MERLPGLYDESYNTDLIICIEELQEKVVALELIISKMNDILFNGVVIIDNGNGYPIEAKRELQTLIEDLK